jgi:hypothetical protein
MDMTRETRCANAEAVVKEQRGHGGALAWDESGGEEVVKASELRRLQAAVMGESRPRDEGQVEV